MAHIASLGAAMFTDLSVNSQPRTLAELNAITDGNVSWFGTQATNTTVTTPAPGQYIRISNIKEFPAIGTPANVVKVPEYGAQTSKQIQGQADAPTMELTLNYIPGLWANNTLAVPGATAGTFAKSSIKINDGKTYLFRFTLLQQQPEGYDADADVSGAVDGSISGDGGTLLANVGNSSYYFLGKLEALEITPSLTDALSAKLTITVQSDVRGAFTVN
jgi:hypothetical protein